MSSVSELHHLKEQARDLLRACHAGDPLAWKRVTLHLPRFSRRPTGDQRLLLAHALFVVARENGFPSWPRLKAAMSSSRRS
ncbi:MAG TPA: hypothetical protein VFB58_11245 [Chloroflexota bacterium]|nr:hypothetical protein [Chloroflexota bacterium]